jgi:hypothetical protein
LWLGSQCLFLFLLMFSCSGTKYSSWKLVPEKKNEFQSYFDNTHTTARYKAEVNSYGKRFSGILFLKFTNDTTCHVAFVSVPGMKLIDMQLTPKTDTVYECMDQLNKAGVIYTIKKNIRIFAMLDNFEGEMQSLNNEAFKGVLWRRYTPNEIYQYYQPSGEKITKIELLTKKRKKKVELTATDFNGNLPSTVHIKQINFNLSIHLTQL